MSVNYNGTVINQRLGVVVTNIDAGAGNGALRLLSSNAQTISLIGLTKPSGTVSGGVLTFSGLPLAAATLLSGSVTSADIEDSNGTLVVSGLTVGPSTAYDIVLVSSAVSLGQVISLTYATITGT